VLGSKIQQLKLHRPSSTRSTSAKSPHTDNTDDKHITIEQDTACGNRQAKQLSAVKENIADLEEVLNQKPVRVNSHNINCIEFDDVC